MQELSRDPLDDSEDGRTGRTGGLARWAGAALSLALVGGVGLWTYQLGQRDAQAVPVIRALEGPSKIQPEDPEGLRVDHQGLTVTAIVEGTPPAPRPGEVETAPAPEALAPEDLPADALPPALAEPAAPVEAPEPDPAVPEPAQSEPPVRIAPPGAEASSDPEPSDDPERIVPADPGTADIPETAPVEEAAEEPSGEVVAQTPEGTPEEDGAGTLVAPERAPRPTPRPAAPDAPAVPVQASPETTAPEIADQVPAAEPPVEAREEVAFPPRGTQLIQLGAFDSPEIAQAQWQRILREHGDLLGTKGPLVQRTISSGRVFFRLRAEGFSDLDEALAICAALTARGVPCIQAKQE